MLYSFSWLRFKSLHWYISEWSLHLSRQIRATWWMRIDGWLSMHNRCPGSPGIFYFFPVLNHIGLVVTVFVFFLLPTTTRSETWACMVQPRRCDDNRIFNAVWSLRWGASHAECSTTEPPELWRSIGQTAKIIAFCLLLAAIRFVRVRLSAIWPLSLWTDKESNTRRPCDR